MRKRWGRFFAVFMIFALILGGLARFVFPLEANHASSLAEMWWGGARVFHAGDFEGYTRNFCDPVDPEARGCTCIALLHGLGDDAMTWRKVLSAPEKSWKKPVKLFGLEIERENHFIPGSPPELYRVRNQAHQIAQALKPLCTRFVVVGNSMGGWIAAWMAIDQDVPVEKLALSGAVGLKSAPSVLGDLEGAVSVEKLKDFEARAYFHPRDISDGVWSIVYKKFKQTHVDQIGKAQTSEDYLDGRLSEVRVPTLLIWGDSDRISPMAGGKMFESKLKTSLWRELPECGHIPQKECTAPYINALNDLLTYQAGSSR